jgi:hypothetical protein
MIANGLENKQVVDLPFNLDLRAIRSKSVKREDACQIVIDAHFHFSRSHRTAKATYQLHTRAECDGLDKLIAHDFLSGILYQESKQTTNTECELNVNHHLGVSLSCVL